MDEIKLGIAQHRGLRAQELLDNTLLNEAFAEIEDRYMSAWRACRAEDLTAREAAWRAIKTLDGIRDLFRLYVTNGKIAAQDLKRLSDDFQRKNK